MAKKIYDNDFVDDMYFQLYVQRKAHMLGFIEYCEKHNYKIINKKTLMPITNPENYNFMFVNRSKTDFCYEKDCVNRNCFFCLLEENLNNGNIIIV